MDLKKYNVITSKCVAQIDCDSKTRTSTDNDVLCFMRQGEGNVVNLEMFFPCDWSFSSGDRLSISIMPACSDRSWEESCCTCGSKLNLVRPLFGVEQATGTREIPVGNARVVMQNGDECVDYLVSSEPLMPSVIEVQRPFLPMVPKQMSDDALDSARTYDDQVRGCRKCPDTTCPFEAESFGEMSHHLMAHHQKRYVGRALYDPHKSTPVDLMWHRNTAQSRRVAEYLGLTYDLLFAIAITPSYRLCKEMATDGDRLFYCLLETYVRPESSLFSDKDWRTASSWLGRNDVMTHFLASIGLLDYDDFYSSLNDHSLGTIFEALVFLIWQRGESCRKKLASNYLACLKDTENVPSIVRKGLRFE
jgi:hypothetical protein